MKYKNYILTLLFMLISVISNGDSIIYDKNDYILNTLSPEPLIVNYLNAADAYNYRYGLSPNIITDLNRKKYLSDLSNRRNINNFLRYLKNKEINESKVIQYNPILYQTNNFNYIEDGVSKSSFIRYIYNNNILHSPIALRAENLNELYDQTLDNISTSVFKKNIAFMQANYTISPFNKWKGYDPKSNVEWLSSSKLDKSHNYYYLKKPTTNPIYINLMQKDNKFPYLLTKDNYNSLRTGDIILIDLLNDGSIDLGGIAFNDGTVEDLNYDMPNKFSYVKTDINDENGYVTTDIIPRSTIQHINDTTSDGLKINENLKHSVIVVPMEIVKYPYIEGNIPLTLNENKNSDKNINTHKTIMNFYYGHFFTDGNITSISEDATYNSLYKDNNFKNKKDIKAGFKIKNDATIEITPEQIKSSVKLTGNPNQVNVDNTPLSEINKTFDFVANNFINGLNFVPIIILILMTVLFILDLAITYLKEIKFANQGVGSFFSQFSYKLTRFSIMVVALYTYPIFLKKIFYPMVLSSIPIYILGLDGSNGILDVTQNINGNLVIDYGKIWVETTKTVLGGILTLTKSSFFSMIFGFLGWLFSFLFNPIKAILDLLTRILLITPFKVFAVIAGVIMAINVVANIYMAAIFMIITTSLAAIYFIFGSTDTFVDKIILILKIMLITMLQYLIQLALLIIVIGTLKGLYYYGVTVTSITSPGDIMSEVMTIVLIFLVIKIPTKISRTLEQAI